jgi:hypothetical protein
MKQAALNVTDLSETRGLSSGAHRLLIGLLTYRNRETGRCDPAINRLCKRVGGVSRRTIFRWLAELRSKGILVVSSRSGTSSSYVFLSGKLAVEACGKKGVGGDKVVTGGGDKVVTGGGDRSVTQRPPHPYMNQTVLNRQSGTAAAATLPVLREPVKKAAAALPLFDQNDEPTSRAVAEELVAELMPVHPEPGNGLKAVAEAEKLLATRPEGVSATAETLRRNHGLWRARWAEYAPGRFVPQLWRWFHDGDWQHPPVGRKPVQSETWHERRERERKQSDEESYRMYAEHGMWDALREYGGETLVEVWREKVKAAG